VAHAVVEREGLRTTYAFAPRIALSVKRDGPTSLQMEFASSPIYRDGAEFRVTQLIFDRVLASCWNDFEFHRLPSNQSDNKLALIEIFDSGIVAELRETGRSLPETVHHFRISFDNHGTYDIVSERLTIAYDVSSNDELYP
jgi:hypothetical protein